MYGWEIDLWIFIYEINFSFALDFYKVSFSTILAAYLFWVCSEVNS